MRLARVGTDAVVLFDLYQPIKIHGCGRGKCEDLNGAAIEGGPRFRVTRFWQIEMCPFCGRPFGYAQADQTMYKGNSLQEAMDAYSAAEMSFFDGSDTYVA